MIDVRFMFGLFLSLLLHIAFVGVLFYLKPNYKTYLSVGEVINVKIYSYLPKSGVASREKVTKSTARKAGKVAKRVAVGKAKSTASFRKSARMLYSKKIRSKPRSKIKKTPIKKRRAEERVQLAKKIKEIEMERELERKIERLRRELSAERKGKISSSSGGKEVALSGSSADLDPLIVLYLGRLINRIRLNWSLPEGITGKEAVISIKISRDGRLLGLDLERSSGDTLFDGSCMRAVKKSFPFDPLPEVYGENYLEVGVRFKR